MRYRASSRARCSSSNSTWRVRRPRWRCRAASAWPTRRRRSRCASCRASAAPPWRAERAAAAQGAGGAEPRRHRLDGGGDRQPGGGRRSRDRAEGAEESARPDFLARIRRERQLDRSQGDQDHHRADAEPSGDAVTKTRVAALQMVSSPELGANLDAAGRLIAEAAASGARLAALPENFYCIGRHESDKVALAEPEGRGPIQDFLSRSAREHRLWLIGGA